MSTSGSFKTVRGPAIDTSGLMSDVGFRRVREPAAVPTVNGSISIYTARRG